MQPSADPQSTIGQQGISYVGKRMPQHPLIFALRQGLNSEGPTLCGWWVVHLSDGGTAGQHGMSGMHDQFYTTGMARMASIAATVKD